MEQVSSLSNTFWGALITPAEKGVGPTSTVSNGEISKQFWRAGDYEAPKASINAVQGAIDHLRVHPKFLHSNATSHKWAFGAIAELLDNAMDEVQNGATFVGIHKIVNPRDSSRALLIQDDGGGMTPDCMRQCMSLGYSAKNTNTTIGQYGNGFKTSTMRLGADVVVFSRNTMGQTVTQSIGLLSYTFLRKTGKEDVVVPMIDYEKLQTKDPLRKLIRSTLEDWYSNLASILQWSPYSSEEELLQQFEDVGMHGTKVIVYNLWLNDDSVLELDFEADEQDIQLRGEKEDKKKAVLQQVAQNHVANRYHHSLRVYASILYLKMPPGFQIVLRGKAVEHHRIISDLKFPQAIRYTPRIEGKECTQNSVVTTIGFTKEAPLINVHGFNVYHKNRLIMPFWKVFQENSSRGRGVVGVLEANYVEPAHDKQDFERTGVFLRLEARLKEMTLEFWNLYCHLAGYKQTNMAVKAPKPAAPLTTENPAPIARIIPANVSPQPVGAPSPTTSTLKPVDGPSPSISAGRPSSGPSATASTPVKVSKLPVSAPSPTTSARRPASGPSATNAMPGNVRPHPVSAPSPTASARRPPSGPATIATPANVLPAPGSTRSATNSARQPARVESLAPAVPLTTSAHNQAPELKREARNIPQNRVKRPSSMNTWTETAEREKRQRTVANSPVNTTAGATNSQVHATTQVNGTSESSCTERPPENAAKNAALLLEKSQLRSRCVHYELEVKKLISKVFQLEKDMLIVKMTNVNLREQLQKYEKDMLVVKMTNVNLQEQLQKYRQPEIINLPD